jgi:hypothetical protein
MCVNIRLNLLSISQVSNNIVSYCFGFQMLKVLEQSLNCGKIPYYWDKRYNLIGGLQDINKQNLASRLKNIIADIEKNVSGSPVVTAKYICKFYVLDITNSLRTDKNHLRPEGNRVLIFVHVEYKTEQLMRTSMIMIMTPCNLLAGYPCFGRMSLELSQLSSERCSGKTGH